MEKGKAITKRERWYVSQLLLSTLPLASLPQMLLSTKTYGEVLSQKRFDSFFGRSVIVVSIRLMCLSRKPLGSCLPRVGVSFAIIVLNPLCTFLCFANLLNLVGLESYPSSTINWSSPMTPRPIEYASHWPPIRMRKLLCGPSSKPSFGSFGLKKKLRISLLLLIINVHISFFV